MKVLGKIVVLIAVALYSGSATQAECPGQFAVKLQGGQVPTAADFQLGDCAEPELAKAIASYLTRPTPPATSDALNVIRVLESKYKEADWRTRFKDLSEGLQRELETSALKFDIPEDPQDRFDLLRNLKENLQNRETQGEEPVEADKSLAEQQTRFLMRRVNDQGQIDQDLQSYMNMLGATVLGFIVLNLVVLGYVAIPRLLPQKSTPVAEPEVADPRIEALKSRVSSGESRLVELVGRMEEAKEEMARRFEEHDKVWNERLSNALSTVLPPANPDLGQLLQDVEALKDSQKAAVSAVSDGDSPSSSITLEREILKEAWNKFRKNEEIKSTLANAWDERWMAVREPLLRHLPQFVPEDLKPTFEAAVASAKDFHALTSKISLVGLLVDGKGKIPPLPSEAQELMRLRELTSLLTMIQTSNLVADRLNFRLEPWVADSFLGFADLFLQRYQKAQMEKRESQLEPGYEIVRSILKIADLEPVDLMLGVTPFDSARHIGRSTASDPSVASGVILGVIRNGFIRGGQQVIRQPEVIVNRVA